MRNNAAVFRRKRLWALQLEVWTLGDAEIWNPRRLYWQCGLSQLILILGFSIDSYAEQRGCFQTEKTLSSSARSLISWRCWDLESPALVLVMWTVTAHTNAGVLYLRLEYGLRRELRRTCFLSMPGTVRMCVYSIWCCWDLTQIKVTHFSFVSIA